MDRLRVLTEDRIAAVMSQDHSIRPFLCVDNIDFEARIHFKRLENSSRMFHGTWGYLHILPTYLTQYITKEEASLDTFTAAMTDAEETPVNLSTFFPVQEEWEHWHKAIKALISQALITYVLPEGIPHPSLTTSPPSIDKIPATEPNIIMLKMMDASDNSAEGVSDMLEHI